MSFSLHSAQSTQSGIMTVETPPCNNPARRLSVVPRYLPMREQALPRTSAHEPVPIYP